MLWVIKVLFLPNCTIFMVLLLWGVDAVLGNGYGIKGLNYVAMLQGSKVPAGFHYRGLILGMLQGRKN